MHRYLTQHKVTHNQISGELSIKTTQTKKEEQKQKQKQYQQYSRHKLQTQVHSKGIQNHFNNPHLTNPHFSSHLHHHSHTNYPTRIRPAHSHHNHTIHPTTPEKPRFHHNHTIHKTNPKKTHFHLQQTPVAATVYYNLSLPTKYPPRIETHIHTNH